VREAHRALSSGDGSDERITTCATTLIRVINSRALLHALVGLEMVRPFALAKRYERFAWLLQIHPSALLARYSVRVEGKEGITAG
jgi:hypothetical protein